VQQSGFLASIDMTVTELIAICKPFTNKNLSRVRNNPAASAAVGGGVMSFLKEGSLHVGTCSRWGAAYLGAVVLDGNVPKWPAPAALLALAAVCQLARLILPSRNGGE
jgi:hypothetical protein